MLCTYRPTSCTVYRQHLPHTPTHSHLTPPPPNPQTTLLRAMRIPFPPPPADALIITGYPISPATSAACWASLTTPTHPGMVLTCAWVAIRFDSTLSPMAAMAPGGGPTNTMPSSERRWAKLVFSERNPYPVQQQQQVMTPCEARIDWVFE